MRFLHRPTIRPPTLAPGGAGYQRAREHRRQREIDPSAKLSFPGDWTRPDVRGALRAMHGWSCAYCQRATADDVDHFRPKSLYWWLAYSFTNYFLSCVTCNSRRKREGFPLIKGGQRATYASQALDDEPRLLIDPAVDPVEEWLRTRWETDCMMENLVDRQNEPVAWARAERTIELFGLNKIPDLRHQRQEQVKRTLVILNRFENDHDLINNLRRNASRFEPHGITVRTILRETACALLPDPEEELGWLVEGYLDLLEHDDYETDRQEICWALAVLWKVPPAGSANRIERRIRERDLIDEIRPCFELLPGPAVNVG